MSFVAFFEDVGPRPSREHSIDRIDNDGNYEPGNVRWANRAEQNSNKSTSVLLTNDGKTMTVAEWSRATGIGEKTLEYRLKNGWSVSDALTTKPERRCWRKQIAPVRPDGSTKPPRGVTWEKGFWRARMRVDGKKVHIGVFNTLEEASGALVRFSEQVRDGNVDIAGRAVLGRS